MCLVCIQKSLPGWNMDFTPEAGRNYDTGIARSGNVWLRMEDMESAGGETRSQPQPQQAGSAQGGTANGTPVAFNQALVDYLDQDIVYTNGFTAPNEWREAGGATAQIITYGFPTSASFASGFGEASGWSAFTNTQKDIARLTMGLWDDLVAASFVESSNGNTADIKFSNTTTNVGYAHAYFPGDVNNESTNFDRIDGSVWFNNSYDSTDGSNDLKTPPVGSSGFATYVHETGHAIGLSHAGDYDGGITYGDPNTGWFFVQDSQQYTIMSYNDETNTGADWGLDWTTWAPYGWQRAAQTPMVYDILAIQQMYGADYTTRADDTTYGFNSTVGGQIYDFNNNSYPVLTIWDGDGTDTIDLSGWSTSSTLSLVAGSYSSVRGMTYNLAIAYDVDIENAIGGSGDDELTGNDIDNILTGNGGSDSLHGNLGNDTLYGGAGDDSLFGGGGNDTLEGGADQDTLEGGGGADNLIGGSGFDIAVYYGSAAGVTIDLSNLANNTGDAAGDTYSGIEQFHGSGNADQITGNAAGNRLYGSGGNDAINGGDGNDLLSGDGGGDVLNGGAGQDNAAYISALTGVTIDLSNPLNNTGDAAGDTYISIEVIQGSRFSDSITGDSANNRLYGSDGDDILIGGAGHDLLSGDAGADVLNGGAGQDNVGYVSAKSSITLDLSNTANNSGDAAGDVYIDVESFQGSNYGDTMIGDSQNNRFYGSNGNDIMSGGGGNDFLSGDAGNDTLTGGTGSDTFFFLNSSSGNDTITDFENDVDRLDFRYLGFSTANDVLDLASTVGNGTLIGFGNGNSITLENFQFSLFDSNDFLI